MDPELYPRVKSSFNRISALPRQERDRAIEELSQSDPDIAFEVQALIQHDVDDADFTPVPNDHRLPLGSDALMSFLPKSIGPYRLVETIGQGGMATVFRASQKHPQRDVAIKVIRPSIASKRALQMFAHEADTLARLKHPGIAHIHDYGEVNVMGERIPYFAMELIEGAPLSQYLQMHEHDLESKLRLFIRICEPVQHAHQKGVVHRDLKPGNILITQSGQPKLLDFGIAKTLDAEALTLTAATHDSWPIGTLAYMSPEQAGGRSSELDVRSDIYALGVLLYEMLLEDLPYRLEDCTVPDAIRTICETPPQRLTRLRGSDLRSVLSHALRKAPEERYAAASELAADIGRILRKEPIAVRPIGLFEVLSKFCLRHRFLVSATLAAVLVLATTLVVAIHSSLRASSEARLRVQGYELVGEEIWRAALDTLSTEGPEGERLRPVLEALVSLHRRDLQQNPGAPEFQRLLARSLLSRGGLDVESGLMESAFGDFSEALALAKSSRAQESAYRFEGTLLLALIKMGDWHRQQRDWTQTRPFYEQAHERLLEREIDEPENSEIKNALVWSFERLGSLYRTLEEWPSATDFLDEARQRCEKALASTGSPTFRAGLIGIHLHLGFLQESLGEPEAASDWYTSAIEQGMILKTQINLRPLHLGHLTSAQISLARLHARAERPEDAAEILEECQELLLPHALEDLGNVIFRKKVMTNLENLGAHYELLGDWRRLDEVLVEGHAFAEKVLAFDSPDEDASELIDTMASLRLRAAYARVPGSSLLTQPQAQPHDQFGIATCGTREFLTVGAYKSSQAARLGGAVFIHRLQDDSATSFPLQILAPPKPSEKDRFGVSLKMTDDVLVIGADRFDGNAEDSGAVFVYGRDREWTLEQVLHFEDGREGDHFGYSVDASRDHIVVGSFGRDAGWVDAGEVLVYRREEGRWTIDAELQPDRPDQRAFGNAVNLYEGRLVAMGKEGGMGSGFVQPYHLQYGQWIEEGKLASSAPSPNDEFGYAIGQTKEFLAIGASGFVDPNSEASRVCGAVFLYRRVRNAWVPHQVLLNPRNNIESQFGATLHIAGDCLVVGAPRDEDCQAFLYRYLDGKWEPIREITPIVEEPSSFFSRDMVIIDNVLFVGTPHASPHGESSGAVWRVDLGK